MSCGHGCLHADVLYLCDMMMYTAGAIWCVRCVSCCTQGAPASAPHAQSSARQSCEGHLGAVGGAVHWWFGQCLVEATSSGCHAQHAAAVCWGHVDFRGGGHAIVQTAAQTAAQTTAGVGSSPSQSAAGAGVVARSVSSAARRGSIGRVRAALRPGNSGCGGRGLTSVARLVATAGCGSIGRTRAALRPGASGCGGRGLTSAACPVATGGCGSIGRPAARCHWAAHRGDASSADNVESGERSARAIYGCVATFSRPARRRALPSVEAPATAATVHAHNAVPPRRWRRTPVDAIRYAKGLAKR